ncbi:MAG: GIY-YIG nuclease family protein [Candidatus Peribacteria bacterium]|nr:MAG: GIY-YIG nuclease family protein [Candidatus Peribacteria bacterium]
MLPISHIPHEPGIYLFCDAKGKYLYIGKAKNLHKRVQQYFTP